MRDDAAALERLRAACASPLDHPGADEQRRASQQVVDFVLDDMAQLAQRPVGKSASRQDMEAILREPLSEDGIGFEQTLHDFRTRVVPHALRVNHPRFLAFVPGAPCFPSLMGDWLCDGLNLFAAQVELVVLDWFCQILGYPKEASGILTGGGSEAILTAVVTARERLAVEERPLAVLYASEQRHWSVDRGARIAGLRSDQIRPLPTGPDMRLPLDVLQQAVDDDVRAGRVPWLVVANAGTTNTGAIDPLNELADFCSNRGLWLHVDAAYGWAVALTADGKQLLHGIERADSISLDPHKWFAQTFDVGCLLVRRGDALAETFAMRPEYLQDVQPGEGEVNFADRGIALTRRFRALKIWFSVKVLGIAWFRRLVEHSCNLAEFTEQLLRQTTGFEVLGRRNLSVVCFRYAPEGWAVGGLDELNRALRDDAVSTGRVFLATTRVCGVIALRVCYINWRTTAGDVDEVVQLLDEIGRRLSAQKGTGA